MKKLDEILDKHLPDAGLCQRGKTLNKQRKERLKTDLLQLMPHLFPNDANALLIVDEQQLGILKTENVTG